MRLTQLAFSIAVLSIPASADDDTPYGWEQCTTTFAGDTNRCLDFVAGPCTSADRDACVTRQSKAWFDFGTTRSLTQAIAPASTGNRIDLNALSNAATTAGNFAGDCADHDVECIFTSTITNVLSEHAPKSGGE